MSNSIERVFLEDGSFILGIELPIDPYGYASFVVPSPNEKSEGVLTQLELRWPELWPEMLSSLKERVKSNLRFGFELNRIAKAINGSRQQAANCCLLLSVAVPLPPATA